MKRLKTLIALFALVFAVCFVGNTSYAATKTTNLKLIKNEECRYSFYGGGKLKTVSSSNSKVVSAKRVSVKGSYYADIKAKKAGNAVVTCKCETVTFKYKIKVYKDDYSMSSQRLANGNMVLSFKNNLSFAYLGDVKVIAKYKNAAGENVGECTFWLYDVGPKKSASDSSYLFNSSQVDLSKTTYKVYTSRSLNDSYSYKDCTNKVAFSSKEKDGKIIITTKYSGLNSKQSVYAAIDIVFYDSLGNKIYVSDYSSYLYSKKKTDTINVTKPYKASSYKLINKRAYMKTYKN